MGDAGIGAVLNDSGLQRVEVRRAAALVDVVAVGFHPDGDDLGAGPAQHPRRDLKRGPVRAVDHHPQAGQRPVAGLGGQRGEQVVEITLAFAGRISDPAEAELGHTTGRAVAAAAAVRRGEPALDLVLGRVRQLAAAAGEELDPVVRRRVVASGQHHTEIGAERVGQVRDRRGRDDAQPQHVNAGTGQAGHDGSLEELTRRPRVPADHGPGTARRRRRRAGENRGTCDREVHGELGRETTACNPPDTVGTEKTTHGNPLLVFRWDGAGVRSALRVLRGLPGLLQPGLLPFLHPGIPGEEAGSLQARAVLRVHDLERPGDAEPQRSRLPGYAAPGDPGHDVERVVDGDTLLLANHARVRLIGVDTPGGFAMPFDAGLQSIVNVSTVEAFRGIPANAVYSAFNAAVNAFTRSLAVELGRDGVRVNAIAPDLADTLQTPAAFFFHMVM